MSFDVMVEMYCFLPTTCYQAFSEWRDDKNIKGVFECVGEDKKRDLVGICKPDCGDPEGGRDKCSYENDEKLPTQEGHENRLHSMGSYKGTSSDQICGDDKCQRILLLMWPEGEGGVDTIKNSEDQDPAHELPLKSIIIVEITPE